MKTVAQETEAFVRARMAEDLAECSEFARSNFARIWPNGVPADELNQAWALVKRTLAKGADRADQ